MSNLLPYMPSFQEEMAKQAVVGKVMQAGRKIAPGLGAGTGAGVAVGGLGGAGIGAVRGVKQERAVGGSGVAGGLTGAITGGMTGAALGAGAGAVGGAAASALGRGKAIEGLVGREGVLGVGARFGQRQVHGLTGWQPKGDLKGIRGGSYATGKELEKAREAGGKRLARAEKAHKVTQEMEQMGATSLPGYLKSLKTHGVAKTVGTGTRQQWHSSGPAMRALMFGFPAVSVGGELVRESKPGESGRLERAGSRIGDVAWTMGGAIPFAGQAAMAAGLGAAGKQVGRVVGTKKKNVPAPPTMEPAGGEAVPAEYMVSPRAGGGES